MADDPIAAFRAEANKRYKAKHKTAKGKRKKKRSKLEPPSISTLSDDELKSVYNEVVLDRELGFRSLRDYAKLCWRILEPGKPYIEGAWHSDCLSDHMQALVTGEIKRLLIAIPPGMGKSTWACCFLPTWAWIHKPHWKMAFGSYNYSFSERDAKKCLKLIRSKFWQERWGDKFTLENTLISRITNSFGGVRAIASVTGQTLGIRADLIVADDPINIQQANSETERAKVHYWWTQGMKTRGDIDKRELVIHQRTHSFDLIGYLLSEVGGYEYLMLPAEFDPKRKCVTYRVDGTKFWEDPRKKEGELLFPQLYPKSFLEEQRGKATVTQAGYSAMYQQDPVPAGGCIIKTEWFRFYPELPEERYRSCRSAILSCDAAVKQKESSSFTVAQIWGMAGPNIYLIDQVRARLSFMGMVEMLRNLVAKWNAAPGPGVTTKLVEGKALGPAIIDTLGKVLPGFVEFTGDDDKESRMHAISWLWESGNIYVPGRPAPDRDSKPDFSHVPWMYEWYEEITRYPKSAYTDQAVTMSQALLYISRKMKRVVGMPTPVAGSGHIYELRQIMKNRPR